MTPFSFARADTVEAAVAYMDGYLYPLPEEGDALPSAYIAGGTNLVDLMKAQVQRPARLLDISHLPLDTIAPSEAGGLLLGALARNADTAYHPLVRSGYPLLSSAILAGASAQIRNMATNGGNLLQRTRCHYFYDTTTPCNKRQPGSGCSALHGVNQQHAILGTSPQCIATHPSDMCVALAALDARVHVCSVRGPRTIALRDFHRLPGDAPEVDTTLIAGELVTHIELPPLPALQQHSSYLKVRERSSYAFALVAVAAALDLSPSGQIREVRVALGGVAHKPWRDTGAEALLVGRMAGTPAFEDLAQTLLQAAHGHGGNDFKIPLAHNAIVRALQMALAGTSAPAEVSP